MAKEKFRCPITEKSVGKITVTDEKKFSHILGSGKHRHLHFLMQLQNCENGSKMPFFRRFSVYPYILCYTSLQLLYILKGVLAPLKAKLSSSLRARARAYINYV